MADQNQQTVEQQVDELSKPGNEAALDKALSAGFNDMTNAAGGDPAGGATPQNNDANTGAENKPAEVDDKGAAQTGTDTDTNAGDPSKGDGEADKGTQQPDGEKKPDRYQDLLADRNEARADAAQAQTENAALHKQVQELTEAVKKLTEGKQPGEGAPSAKESATDDPYAGLSPAEIAKKVIEEHEASKNQAADAEKSITEDIAKLEGNPDTPNAGQYKEQIAEAMRKHPTISAYAAYAMLRGAGTIPAEAAADPSNANRTGTGNRSKTTLHRGKNPNEMSQAELEAHLQKEQRSGGMQGLL